jgi:hypothetical protein
MLPRSATRRRDVDVLDLRVAITAFVGGGVASGFAPCSCGVLELWKTPEKMILFLKTKLLSLVHANLVSDLYVS